MEKFTKAVKESEELYRSLIEAILDPLVTIDAEGKITHMNKAMINITGLSREDLTGTNIYSYFTEPEKAQKIYKKVFAKKYVSDAPLTLKHKKNGKLTDVLFNGSIYKDKKGNILGAMIIARDVTEQKKFENELIEAKSNAELEKKKAQEAVKAKQQFLSNMSHEIRTPMNAIIGFTKVVLKSNLTEKQREYLNAIKISGDALIVLINDILDLAKVDSGKMTFEKTPFKLGEAIPIMLSLFDTKVHSKKLALIKKYDPAIPEVILGDPARLQQIILNLLSNAVKFTTEGEITVSVKLLKEDEEKVTIEFAVTDTGIGIPEDRLESIFDNFQQATSGTSRIYGGTGLGLAIVKQFVEAQGGTLSVKSKIGVGSTFSFSLDFKKTKEKITEETEQGLEPKSGVKNIRILVAEDVTLNQLLMKTLLEEFGFKMDSAVNGKIAVEKLKKHEYDLVLMDLQMPVMNGFEATNYIRNTLHSEIPIIALTADVTTVDIEKCRALGMNDYIAKPINDKVLYEKIMTYLRKPAHTNKTTKSKNGVKKQYKYIDLEYLNKHTKNNNEMIREIINVYLQETPKYLETIKQSIRNKKWDEIALAAHSIIPSFLIMGISTEYEEMIKKIQILAAKKENLSEINTLFKIVEEACTQACKELEIEFKTLENLNY